MSGKYRAVIINGRKVVKNIVSAFIGITFATAVIFGIKASGFKFDTNSKDEIKKEETVNRYIDLSFFSFENIIKNEIPFLNNYETQLVFNADNDEREEILPKSGMIVGLSGELPIREIDSSQNKAIGTDKILIKNETKYKIDTNELLKEPLGFDMSQSGPKVLIVHTHGSESYSAEGENFYIEGTGDRNLDTSFNVVHIGDKITEVFEKYGVEVIHDRRMHDQPSYNGSYNSSLTSIEKYTKEYPSIQIVLDIHRDAIVYQDGTKAKTVTEIDGQRVAQLMFVVGTNEGGLTHDNWRENLKFAIKLQNATNKKYPSLMRGINLRRERFNGHTTKGSIIIEVGTSGNTLAEAERGGVLLAEIIADFINGI